MGLIEYQIPGRPKKTEWERATEIAKYVDRARSHTEGSIEYKQNRNKAIDIVRTMVKVEKASKIIGIPVVPKLIIKELGYIKIKIIELIKELG